MSATGLDRTHPVRAGTRDCVLLSCLASIGAGGAIAAVYGDPGLTITKEVAAGTYKAAFPPRNVEQFKRTMWVPSLYSPALTVVSAVATDAGTFLSEGEVIFKTVDAAGAAANPAEGDVIMFLLKTPASGVRQ